MSMFTSEILVSDQPVEVDGTVAVSAVSGTVTVDGSGVTQPVSGTVAVSAVSGTVTVDGSGVTQPVSGTFWQTTQPVSGTVTVTPSSSNSSSVAPITSTGANQTLLAANASRKQAILFFESGLWSVKLGAVASTTSLTYKVTANNTTMEIPAVWVGQIDAICTTTNKIVHVTEIA